MHPVYHSLHARGLTTARLAQLIGCRSHAQISQVLNNLPGRGGVCVRRKLARHLTPEERALLGWDNVPHGT